MKPWPWTPNAPGCASTSPGKHGGASGSAAQRDQSIQKYVSDAIEARLQDDLPDETLADPAALRASADPVLAELWGNPADAAHDNL